MNPKYLHKLDRKDLAKKQWSKWNILCHIIHERWLNAETDWILSKWTKFWLTIKAIIVLCFIPRRELKRYGNIDYKKFITIANFHGRTHFGVECTLHDWDVYYIARHGFDYIFGSNGYP